MTIASPIALGLGLVLLAAMLVLARRTALPRSAAAPIALGAAALALAASGPAIQRPAPRQVLVLVDLSPSTRTAAYRDRAALDRRIGQLLAGTDHRIACFADGSAATTPDPAALADVPCDRTRFPTTQADAIVLFSDGQFAMPADAPPTYPVLDRGLLDPADAAVTRLDLRDSATAAAAIRNSGQPRLLSLIGAGEPTTRPIGEGAQVVTGQIGDSAGVIVARLSGGDPFPENDALAIRPPSPQERQRWWVGNGPAPLSGWRTIAPAKLPTDPADYLAPAMIVLDNIPASALATLQQERLDSFVRELGGGLLIIGGDSAFSAGGYAGSTIEALSPLASTPPQPTRRWILLADSSGSMAAPAAGESTRWQLAAESIMRLLPRLPPNDRVTIGSFARDLRWWAQDQYPSALLTRQLPGGEIRPRGPTNLQAALEAIASQLDGSIPSEILLISDADAQIDDPATLAAALRAGNARLHLLATGAAPPAAVRQLVELNGGQTLSQNDPLRWAEAMRALLRAAAPSYLETSPLAVRFEGRLSSLRPHPVATWNRVWMKDGATRLATGTQDSSAFPAAAMWGCGNGNVAAVAFAPNASEIEAMASLIAKPPRDPRFEIAWRPHERLAVAVDAGDRDGYLNGLDLVLEVDDPARPAAAPRTYPLEQTAPGHYELAVPAPSVPVLAVLRQGQRALDQVAVAGRYPAEFSAIGTDVDALRALAARTGGSVIEPDRVAPIDFHWPGRPLTLVPVLAAAGAALVALGLVPLLSRSS